MKDEIIIVSNSNLRNQSSVSRPTENNIIAANKNVSNLIISEKAYRNRKISRELAVTALNSEKPWTKPHISNVLNNVHAGRLFNVLPLNILYPDLTFEKLYLAVIFGLWTNGSSYLSSQKLNLPLSDTDQQIDLSLPYMPQQINLSLPDTSQQINLNMVLVEDLDQILLNNGTEYINLQERIGKDFSKLPSQIFIEGEVLPVRTLIPTIYRNHIWAQHRLLPVNFLYNEKFYQEAHQAGLYSGPQATSFCYKYLGFRPPMEKSDHIIGGDDSFIHKVGYRKLTDIKDSPSSESRIE